MLSSISPSAHDRLPRPSEIGSHARAAHPAQRDRLTEVAYALCVLATGVLLLITVV